MLLGWPTGAHAGWSGAESLGTSSLPARAPQVSLNGDGDGFAVWVQADVNFEGVWARRYLAGTGWADPVVISSDQGIASRPHVAVDERGNAVAVWLQSDGTRDSTWANRYVAGVGWGTAELIEDGGGRTDFPQVAVDGSGNAIAVWHQDDGLRDRIWANRYVAGLGWGAAVMIGGAAAGSEHLPQVAMSHGGKAVAVWQLDNGVRSRIWAARCEEGVWGTAEVMEGDITVSATDPQVAVDNAGVAFAVWSQNGSGHGAIWASRGEEVAGWSPAEMIQAGTPVYAVFPQVATDGGGNAVAVWYVNFGTQLRVIANRYAAGGGWGTSEAIYIVPHGFGSGDGSYPHVSMNARGDAMAVWQQSQGAGSKMVANRCTAGKGWERAFTVESGLGSVTYPRVALDGEGNAVAVFEQDSRVLASRYAARGWGTAVMIENIAGNASSPSVAIGVGEAIAVWSQSDGAQNSIWANRLVPGNGWGPDGIASDSLLAKAYPQVAIDGGGNAVAVWGQHDGTRWNIMANLYNAANGGWWGFATLIEGNDAGDAISPQVAVDQAGNAIAVWPHSDGARDHLWANRMEVGGAWGTPVLIEGDGTGTVLEPHVAVDGSGNAVAVWSQYDGSRINIWANRYEAGVGWGAARTIARHPGNGRRPRVAMDGSGNAFAVWHQDQDNGTRLSVWANRMDVGGGWGTATLLESDDTGDALSPQVAVDGSGSAVAVWQQRSAASSWYRVHANRHVPGAGWGVPVTIEHSPGDSTDPHIVADDRGRAVATWTSNRRLWSSHYVPGIGWGEAVGVANSSNIDRADCAVASDGSGIAAAVWSQNEGTGRNIYAVVLDMSIPSTTVAPRGGAYGAPQTVELICGDDQSGCHHIYYTTDGTVPTVDSRIYAAPLAISSNTTLRFFAADKSGNREAIRTETYVIDADPPVTTASPRGGLSNAGRSVRLNCADGAGSGCDATLYCLGIGCTPATAYDGNPIDISETAVLRFSSVDKVGNAEPVSEETYTIDTLPPDTIILEGIAPPDPTNSPSAVLVFVSTEESSTFECRLDGAGFTPCVAPRIYSGLAEGIHTFQVRATDLAGNPDETPAGYTWRIDTGKPSTTAAPGGGTYTVLKSISLTCSDGDGLGCAVNPIRYCRGAGCTPTTPYAQPIPIEGDTVLRFYSTDLVGNAETVQEQAYAYVQAGTELTLSLSHPTILQGDPLAWAAGQLSRIPDNGMDLSGLPVDLLITNPYGKTVSMTTTTEDVFGHYRFTIVDPDSGDVIPGFNLKGTYGIRAVFTGNGVLARKESAQRNLLVGQTAGYAILVEGRISSKEGLASHNKTANRIYRTLLDRGFVDENIQYFNYDTNQADIRADAAPTKAGIQAAIEQWALLRMLGAPAPLYVIMVDHGNVDAFHIDDGNATIDAQDVIAPADLNGWLATLEDGLAANNPNALAEKRIVVIGACYSGSFVPALAKSGRVVVTSATAEEESYKGTVDPSDGVRSGEFFLDELFIELGRGRTLRESFVEATARTARYTERGGANGGQDGGDDSVQHPLLDDDGVEPLGSNGLSEGAGDGVASDALTLGVGLTNAAANPAELVRVAPTQRLAAGTPSVTLWANAQSDAEVDHAWVEVRNLAEELAGQGGSGQLEPKTMLHLLSWDASSYAVSFDGSSLPKHFAEVFPNPGKYEIYYFSQRKQTLEVTSMKRSVVYLDKAGNGAPGAFALVEPADDPDGLTPVDPVLLLNWEDSVDPDSDAVSYHVMISTSPDVARADYICDPTTDICREELTSSALEIDLDAGLQGGTTYHWKVVAVDAFGAATPSATWSFTTKNTNPELPGFVKGCVTNSMAAGVSVRSPSISSNRGSVMVRGSCYSLLTTPGPVTISVTASGYAGGSAAATVVSGSTTTRNVSLTPVQHTLAVQTAGNGSGTVSGGGRYYHGTTHAVSAAPLTGSVFSGWSGDCTGTVSRVSVLVDRDKTCTATFTLIPPGNRAPVLAPVGNRTVNETRTLSFRLGATDADGDTLSFTAAGLPVGATLDRTTGVFRWTPAHNQAGIYTVTLRVSDGFVIDSETVTITVLNQVIIYDDFAHGTSSGDPDWKVLFGSWGVTGTAKAYTSNALKPVNLALTRKVANTYSSGVVSFKAYLLKPTRGMANVTLLFAYKGASLFRYVELLPGRVAVGQVGSLGGQTTLRKEFPTTLVQPARWLAVRATLATDGTVTVAVGTKVVATWKFTQRVAGNVGVRANAAKTILDNFMVQSALALQ